MSEQVILVLIGTLGGGFIASVIGAIVTLVRGRSGDKRTDKKLRADITDQVTDMASDWLDRANIEIKALRAEVDALKLDRERLAQAEREVETLKREVETLKRESESEQKQRAKMIGHVSAVHDWIESGATPPPPARPPWAPRLSRTIA